MATLSLTEVGVLTALRSFLLGFLPAGVEVIRAEINRVSEPRGVDFVVMTPILRGRLSTNVVTVSDVVFTGSIAGNIMTVTAVASGVLAVGQSVIAPGVALGTVILSVGDAGVGTQTFTVSISQTVASQALYAGTRSAKQATQVTVQLDVHGPNSADNAQMISTLFRDEYATTQFKLGIPIQAASGSAIQTGWGALMTEPVDVQPLYASDPRQTPFINAENQYEYRWTIDAVMQANPIVTTPQQFMDQITVTPISVDAGYHP
jgi:hypothetical protein